MPMRWWARLVAGFLAAALLAPPAVVAADTAKSEPWLDGLFRASPSTVLAAANALRPHHGDVHVLYREASYTFELDHRATFRQTLVYQILSEAGLQNFGASEARFRPWHQDPPTIRARILTPSGTVHELDPRQVKSAGRKASVDARETQVLRLELPGVTVGAVVEEVITVYDREPYFSAGQTYKHRLVMPHPIQRQRLIFDAPTLLPLRYGVRLADLEPERQIESERVRLVFEDGPRPAAGPIEAGLPANLSRYPHIAFATGKDWASVVDTYRRQLEVWWGGFELPEALVRKPPKREDPERIRKFFERLKPRLRVDPDSLTDLPPLPEPPGGVWTRERVSSLEAAAMTVALLRNAEIQAHVALVRRGLERDVEANLPGLGGFDRALVMVPGAGPSEESFWIDPAEPLMRPGELPVEFQGRRALVLAREFPKEDPFVRTPVSGSGDNRTEVEIQIELAAEGPGRVVETSRFHGVPEWLQRRLSFGLSAEERRTGYADYARLVYRATLGDLEEGDPADLSEPYWLRLEALRSGRVLTEGAQAVVGLSISDLLLSLPAPFLIDNGPRRQSFAFPYAYEIEWRVRIEVPRGFQATAIPRDEVWSLGSVRLSQSFTQDGGAVEARFHLDSGPRVLTPEQFEETRFRVGEFWRRESLVVEFERR